MRRTEWLQEIRKMRFEEVYFGWSESRLTHEKAARTLGVYVIGRFGGTLIGMSMGVWRVCLTGV
ncbi:MAG: hypothetical protein Q7J12_04435 [Syntrophales bacterium]|nr:hypothetical protein [Syntrophales bacterium]